MAAMRIGAVSTRVRMQTAGFLTSSGHAPARVDESHEVYI
jgi:hypothetical protein